jgi:hypothetical protein
MNTYEIKVYGRFIKVDENIFRSWSGERKLNGETYHGEVFHYLSDKIFGKRV